MLICKNCRIVMNHTTSGIIAAQQYDNNTYRGASGVGDRTPLRSSLARSIFVDAGLGL